MYEFSVIYLIKNLHIAALSLQDFAICTGLFLVFSGFMTLKKYGETRTYMSQHMTLAKPLMLVGGGSLLLFTPILLGTAIQAFWGQINPLSYSISNAQAQQLLHAIIIFIRVLGIGVFIRGWVMLAKSGDHSSRPDARTKALMHILVGVLLMHFIGTEHLVIEALGFQAG